MATRNEEGQSTIFFSTCPRTKDECTVYVGMARDYALDRPDDAWIQFTGEILEQDRPIVESQRPEMLPVDLREEIHLRFADKPGIEFRRLLADAGLDYA
jgi:vanillate O-demethylase monooxygenase subunit